MDRPIVNPTHWPVEYLISHGEELIHELALKSAGTLSSYRLVLGRCLLAVERTKLYEKLACSSAIHYASLVLGLDAGEACTMRRVARRLEELPRLTVAAELGHISWSKLREIVRKASPETEELWLSLASRMSYRDIERLVRATDPGKLPWEDSENPDSLGTRRQLFLCEETGKLFERVQSQLSRQLERRVTACDALRHLLVGYLTAESAGTGDGLKDVAAAKRAHSKLVLQAWELCQKQNLDTVESPLAVALGGHPGLEAAAGAPSEPKDQSGPEAPRETDEPDEPKSPRWSAPRPARVMTVEVPLAGGPIAEIVQPQPARAAGEHSTPRPLSPALLAELQRRDWSNPRVRFNPKARSTTPAQRRELLRRDGYCCATPGCPHKTWLEHHHIVSFKDNGPSRTFNLITLCSRCHRHVHDGRLHIEGNADQTLMFRDAEGKDLARAYGMEVAGWLNVWIGWRGSPEDCYLQQWACAAG